MSLAPGTHVGHYEILSPLGAGGMGEVYRARDPRLARDVAIKILPEHLASDADAMARFKREARAVAALSHPNILAIYDVGSHEGASYAVTELLEGETLRSRLVRSPVTWKQAAEIGAAMADGVAAAHARGIVHRDLKPENVFVTSDGRVKVLDFGIARVQPARSLESASGATTETLPGAILGTVGYMSPEQVRGETTEAASDLFSLGCVLYEMIAGQAPYARASAVQTLSAILESEPPPFSASGKEIPTELEGVISRCLQKDPARRTQSARDLSFALGDLQRGAHPVQSQGRNRPVKSVVVTLGIVALAVIITVLLRERSLGPSSPAVIESPVNPEAYEALLRARYLSTRTNDEDSREAIALLERAIALDPGFAPSHAALAAAYVSRLNFVAPEEARALEQQAYAAAERALSLDPNVAEAYLARGLLLWTPSFRFPHDRAVQEFRRALSLNPNLDRAHEGLARVFVHLGFFQEAIQHVDQALRINPANALAPYHRSEALLWNGESEEALAALSSTPPAVVPEQVEANTIWALSRLGRQDEAWRRLREASQDYPADATGVLASVEAMLLADTDPGRAVELIEKVEKRKAFGPSHHAAYFAGCAWARMGRAEESVKWLREAADTGFPCYPLLARDASLDPIRQDPRFQTFLADVQKQTESLRDVMFPEGIAE